MCVCHAENDLCNLDLYITEIQIALKQSLLNSYETIMFLNDCFHDVFQNSFISHIQVNNWHFHIVQEKENHVST